MKCLALLALLFAPPFAQAQLLPRNRPTVDYRSCPNGTCTLKTRGDTSVQFATPTAVAPPTSTAVVPIGQTHPTGVDVTKFRGQGYTHNGKQVTRYQALAAIESKVPDLTGKRRITVIGTVEQRNAALTVIGKPSWAVVKAYAPDDWYVVEQGFVTTGSPTTYITESDGKVVHRQDDLTNLKQAVTKADPSYDPKNDPDTRAKVEGFDVTKLHPLWYVGGIVAAYLLFRKKT